MRKNQKNKNMVTINVDTKCIANQMREANEIRLKEMMLKDRVDISRKEYEEMKSELEYLRGQKEDYDRLFELLKVEKYYDRIIPETVAVQEVKNPESQKTYIKIVFEVKFTDWII